jgi:hypothetical protein
MAACISRDRPAVRSRTAPIVFGKRQTNLAQFDARLIIFVFLERFVTEERMINPAIEMADQIRLPSGRCLLCTISDLCAKLADRVAQSCVQKAVEGNRIHRATAPSTD